MKWFILTLKLISSTKIETIQGVVRIQKYTIVFNSILRIN